MGRLAWLWPVLAIMLAAKWGPRMKDWGFWEWVAYGTIWVGALIIAADAGFKLTGGTFRAIVAPIFESPFWAFLPLFCIVVGTIIIGSRELGLLGGRPLAPQAQSAGTVRGETATQSALRARS